MPYRKEQFSNGEIYHVVSRALDNNLIFKDINDYYRGIFSIYEFNNADPVEIWKRRRDRMIEKKKEKMWEVGSPPVSGSQTIFTADKRDKFLDILVFCFMPNHIHLLLKQIKENGVTNFMKKLGSGYGSYFNKKYNRKGYVFQNRFKDVHIENDNQLKVIFTYIHTNPISLIEPGWKENGIKDKEKTKAFLEEYKWSSYLDYIDKKNFPSITEREFLTEVMGGAEGCKSAINNWIYYKHEISKFSNILLD